MTWILLCIYVQSLACLLSNQHVCFVLYWTGITLCNFNQLLFCLLLLIVMFFFSIIFFDLILVDIEWMSCLHFFITVSQYIAKFWLIKYFCLDNFRKKMHIVSRFGRVWRLSRPGAGLLTGVRHRIHTPRQIGPEDYLRQALWVFINMVKTNAC